MSEGKLVEIFNGRDLTGWKPIAVESTRAEEPMGWRVAGSVSLHPDEPKKFMIHPGEGVLVNGVTGRTVNLITEKEYGDIELHIEFVVAKGSNSGVKFMGVYEIQISDGWGRTELRPGSCGGIYSSYDDNDERVGGAAPRVNASRPPGEWQSFDIVFRAAKFDDAGKKVKHAIYEKVVWNGKIVHENEELLYGPSGRERSRLPGPERPKGPLFLQGDHGAVAFRNIRVREI